MSNFDEWFEQNYWQLSADKNEAKDTFKAGAASRQAEIGALNALGEMSEQKIDDLVLRNIELQKRIDEALEALQDGSFNYCEKILKGKNK